MLNKQIAMHKMRRIQSKKYKIGTYEINEISLSCFDDKRFVLDDGIQKLAYFHKDLKKNRFSPMIIYKKRLSKMIINKKKLLKMIMDKKRSSQIKTSTHI